MRPVFRLETGEGRVVADRVEVADGVLSRFLGLMFRARLPEGQGLALTPCSSVHMLFMRFPLDVVFVDREGRVVKVAGGLRPWTGAAIARGATTAIELAAGTAEGAGLAPGSPVRMVPGEEAPSGGEPAV